MREGQPTNQRLLFSQEQIEKTARVATESKQKHTELNQEDASLHFTYSDLY